MSVDLLSYNPQPLLSFAVQICHGGVIVWLMSQAVMPHLLPWSTFCSGFNCWQE
jgi:hypothetical protein